MRAVSIICDIINWVGFLIAFCFLAIHPLRGAPTIQTVCASGCTTSNLQTAINTAAAANTGPQIIVLTAGENFDTAVGFALPARTGVVTLTGDADPTASRTLVGSKTLFLSELSIGDVITVNAEARTVFSIESDTSLTVDLAFTDTAGGAAITKPYTGWIILRSSRVNELPGNTRVAPADVAKLATLRVTAGGYTPVLYTSGHPSAYWRLEGLGFTVSTTSLNHLGWLIGIGHGTDAAEIEPSLVSHHIAIDRCYIHGIAFDQGPRDGIRVNGNNVEVLNSYISEIKRDDTETHGILGYSLNGPLLVRNTFIGGAAIGSLIGGATPNNVSILPTNVQFLGNHYQGTPTHRALRYAFDPQGTAAPAVCATCANATYWDSTGENLYVHASGAWRLIATGITGSVCVDGDFWRNTATSTSWNCTSGAWVSGGADRTITGGSVSPFTAFASKNRFEFKMVTGGLAEGNLIENCFSPTTGQQSCAAFLMNWIPTDSLGSTVRNVRIQNNLIRRTGQMYLEGIISDARIGYFTHRYPYDVEASNNLVQDGNNPGVLQAINKLTYYNVPPVLTALGGVGVTRFSNSRFLHNTVINPLTSENFWNSSFMYSEADGVTGRMVSDNVFETGSLGAAANWTGGGGCASFAGHWANGTYRNNVIAQLGHESTNAAYYDTTECRSWAFPWKRTGTGVRVAITDATISGGSLIIHFGTDGTSDGHGLLQGTKVKLAGWTPAGLNGTYTVPRLHCGGPAITAQSWQHTMCLPTVETGAVTSGTIGATVDYTDYAALNFRLASTSAYKGWATDGSDPGANQDMVEWATATASAGTDNPYLDFRVRSITPTADGAVFKFTAYSDAACTWRVDGTRAFTSADSTPVQTRVGRDGTATITGLSSDTGYWYRVTCDSRTRDGQFVTTH